MSWGITHHEGPPDIPDINKAHHVMNRKLPPVRDSKVHAPKNESASRNKNIRPYVVHDKNTAQRGFFADHMWGGKGKVC